MRRSDEGIGRPYSMMMLEIDTVIVYNKVVGDIGKVFVTTELGGGGSSSARSNVIARRGIRNVLIQSSMLQGQLDLEPSVMLDILSSDCFTFAEHDGLFEIYADLDAIIRKGDIVAKVWPSERTGVAVPTANRT